MKRKLSEQEQKTYLELKNDLHKHTHKDLNFNDLEDLINEYAIQYKEMGLNLIVNDNVKNNVMVEITKKYNVYKF